MNINYVTQFMIFFLQWRCKLSFISHIFCLLILLQHAICMPLPAFIKMPRSRFFVVVFFFNFALANSYDCKALQHPRLFGGSWPRLTSEWPSHAFQTEKSPWWIWALHIVRQFGFYSLKLTLLFNLNIFSF